MVMARAGAALFVFCLGTLPAAGAEQALPTADRMLVGSPVDGSAPSEMLRLAATKKQAVSRTQQGRTEERVAKLEQRVAELEAQVEQLHSILKVDGQDVTISGRNVRIEGQQAVDVRASQTTVESQGRSGSRERASP